MPKKKIVALNKDDFFRKVSFGANFVSEDIIKDVYYSVIRVLGQELSAKGAVCLPEWGDFVLHKYKQRSALNVHTRRIELLPERSVIKFRPCQPLKKHFHLKGL